jgi:hypothetical protein
LRRDEGRKEEYGQSRANTLAQPAKGRFLSGKFPHLQEYNRLVGFGTPVIVAAGYLDFPKAQRESPGKATKVRFIHHDLTLV